MRILLLLAVVVKGRSPFCPVRNRRATLRCCATAVACSVVATTREVATSDADYSDAMARESVQKSYVDTIALRRRDWMRKRHRALGAEADETYARRKELRRCVVRGESRVARRRGSLL